MRFSIYDWIRREADVATAHPSSDRCAAHFVRGISRRRERLATICTACDAEAASPHRLRSYLNHKSKIENREAASPLPLRTTIYPLPSINYHLPLTLNPQRATHQIANHKSINRKSQIVNCPSIVLPVRVAFRRQGSPQCSDNRRVPSHRRLSCQAHPIRALANRDHPDRCGQAAYGGSLV